MAQSKYDYTPEKFATFPQWARRQLFEHPRPVTGVDLSGKTAIVTGANQGIGFEIADQLITLNISKLIIGARDEAKGQAAADKLKAQHKSAKTDIEVWKLDMLEYDSVTSFATRASQLEHLDLVILNAGIYRIKLTINPSTGNEEDIQTNYLSTVLLTVLLLPTLQAKKRSPESPGRLTIVSSDTAGMTHFVERDADPLLGALKDTSGKWKWDMQERYGTSKLLGQLFLTELAKRVPTSVAIINAGSPGLCAGSGLSRDAAGTFLRFPLAIYFGIFGRKSAVGAHVVLDAALKKGEESHGEVIDFDKIRPKGPFAYSPKAQEVTERLWRETMQELAFADVQTIVQNLSAK
ncbi:NAD(P)-binding protein [Cryphonectria parasitica EP155]|uniref:NAD(P)-binding protein n=1 Tax=Cryphonectria parasitica (strain ATCC 38755 / EP155) TaxID=660469 RepID=A0A9P4Y549_CRYP1|nr:NAD(P)-binding protein [Cryphonectria parasitica EP155]KAF3766675.1 NAD(P)-binding protein [Cryphonectria parasitica EP155]